MQEEGQNAKTILLVEDDTFLVNMYTSKFQNDGFNVITANDGETGLDLALKNRVDIVILDLMLPKLSGVEVLTRLRKDEKGKDVPVIVLSNLSKEDESEDLFKLGVKDYLLKANLTPTQLVDKIQEYLG